MTKSKAAKARREQLKAESAARINAVEAAARRRRLLNRVVVGGVIGAVVGVLFLVYRSQDDPKLTEKTGGSGQYVYQVGNPSPGEQAIDFTLPSTRGGEVGLSDYAGKTVLTYWHEGLGCQPCWDQIRDLEQSHEQLVAAGIDEFVSITSGPVDLIEQKMTDDGLDSVALADTNLEVSRKYEMNKFGMMGDSRDGHTFLLIGPDGEIQWRADYGGAPNYTMYIPVENLLADLDEGRQQ